MLNKKNSGSELPASPTQLKAPANNMSAEERLIRLLSNNNQQQQLPIVSLPDSDNYWSEGWKCSSDLENNSNDLSIVSSTSSPVSSSSASPLSSASSSPSSFFQSNSSASSQHHQASNKKTPSQVQVETMTELSPEYLDAFNDKQHLAFYGHDSQDMPVILSYKTESCASPDSHDVNLRAVLRTKEKNYCMLIPLVNLNTKSIAENCDNIQITPALVTRAISPDIKMKFFYPLTDLNGFKLIKNFDNHAHNKNLKFGVIYMKKGQTTEEELFSNQEHSESFEKFLGLLGQRIKLKGHQGFRGGLDTVNGQTGDYSVYDKFNTKEIMFHVSTLLPFSKSDQQQLERKRHIGNDIVAIVFQEDNTPFAPDMIASNFLHTFIVVQRFNEPIGGKEKYRVSVIARKDVPNFSPPITAEGIYENDDSFREWLLQKLLNAEQACYKAEKFKKLNERTRSALFGALYNDLHERNMRIMQSVFFNQQVEEESNSASSVHSGFSSRVLEQSNSGSNLLGSPTAQTGSSQNINQTGNQSAAFKFSLLNTVRKAFKKSEPIKQAVPVSQAQLHRPAGQTHSVPTPLLKSPSKTDVHRGSFSHDYPGAEQPPVGRNRSSTFDSGNSYKSQQLLPKNQLEPQQPNSMFSSRKDAKTSDRLSKHIDYGNHLYGKIGSIDSLNNVDNYSHGFRQNPNGPNGHHQTTASSSRDSGKQGAAHAIKPKTLNLNNMSLSDLSNSVRYKANNSPFASYADSHRSGSSSPESQTNGSIQSKKQFGRLTKNSLMKSATSIRNDDSDTGMGSLTPNSSGLSSASTTDFYSTNLHHNHHSMIIK